jgi:FecR protein
MKQTLLLAGLFFALAAAAYAVPTDVTYTEGDATTRYTNGKQQDTSTGDVLNTGDSLKTGDDGLVEMDQKGVTIKVNHGTVFTLMEKEQNGSKAPVLSVALGSIKFRYNKLTGHEPLVRTNAAVLGVRGTEFTVFSGADGSTLVAVDSGQVTVEAEGKSVQLASAEGVEVGLGKPPGDKFVVHSDQIDYSKWNDDKLKAMLADPIAALKTIEDSLVEYSRTISDYYASYLENNNRLTAVRQERVRIFKEKGAEEARKFLEQSEMPVAYATGLMELNMRYFSIGALSLRRFVGGRLYVSMKSRYIANPHDPIWTDFLAEYASFLSLFEQSVAPHLVPADI